MKHGTFFVLALSAAFGAGLAHHAPTPSGRKPLDLTAYSWKITQVGLREVNLGQPSDPENLVVKFENVTPGAPRDKMIRIITINKDNPMFKHFKSPGLVDPCAFGRTVRFEHVDAKVAGVVPAQFEHLVIEGCGE